MPPSPNTAPNMGAPRVENEIVLLYTESLSQLLSFFVKELMEITRGALMNTCCKVEL